MPDDSDPLWKEDRIRSVTFDARASVGRSRISAAGESANVGGNSMWKMRRKG